MIARIFNTLPVPIKMLEDKKEFVCKWMSFSSANLMFKDYMYVSL